MSDKPILTMDAQFAALVPRFLGNRAADVGRIRAALAGGDFEAIRAVAHGMKGSGGGYGFPEISRLGAAMEEGARRRDVVAIVELIASLEACLARIEAERDHGPGGPGSV
jgi:HPt (histidine-containing phosphotransfer) domain-containing protein